MNRPQAGLSESDAGYRVWVTWPQPRGSIMTSSLGDIVVYGFVVFVSPDVQLEVTNTLPSHGLRPQG